MPTDPFAPLAAVAEPGLAFTALDGQAFVRLPVASGGFFNLPVRSAAFRDWFYCEFYGRYAAGKIVQSWDARRVCRGDRRRSSSGCHYPILVLS